MTKEKKENKRKQNATEKVPIFPFYIAKRKLKMKKLPRSQHKRPFHQF